MRKTIGNKYAKLLECINPVKNKWRIRWAMCPAEDDQASYMEADFDHKPTADEIKKVVIEWYNNKIDGDILRGFSYKGNVVWLTTENQFNYKAAYDLAVQTGGNSLPVVFKFGSEESPVYHKFDTITELTDFYVQAMVHVQNVLKNGWEEKDSFDVSKYE